ncbi:colicin immunity domain-containing protein [Longimycelium tulufanense]|uniref:colicin immunity domain-containing protein n=1 Tax=Longimycelium tulufanense TaxID=907463 RepID=UPI001662C35B|nr:colicin immunity domain-containing protein [Longimycelium tulufanense]
MSLVDSAELADATWRDTEFVVALPDVSAALVVTTQGYSLLGGDPAFVNGAMTMNGGVDAARALFRRQAKKVGDPLRAIAAQYPPTRRSWKTAQEVEPGSAVADQLTLMTALVTGEISPKSFEMDWYDAWRRERDSGERTHGVLYEALKEMFFFLEDYTADASLREPGDPTDDDLLRAVREVLTLLDL